MNGLLFFFSALGAFNGILLCIYLFFFTKEKSLSKYLLGGLILALSIRIGKSVLLYFDPNLPKTYLQIGLSACFFIGPFLFFYLKSVIEGHKEMPKLWAGILLAFAIFITAGGIIRPYQTYPDFWNTISIYIIYWQWLFFMVGSAYLSKDIFKKVIQKDPIPSNEKWLLAIFTANFIIFTNYFVVLYGFSAMYYITGPLVFSFFLYLAIFGYFYTDGTKEFSNQKPIGKYANKKIDQTEAQQLIQQLDLLMVNEKVYTNPKLKLKTVAEKLAISPHHLSQLLNDNLGKSFAIYINEHRIQAACKFLGTTHNLSLEGIGYEVGFSSKSNFFINFKKVMSCTPAQFQQQISLQNA